MAISTRNRKGDSSDHRSPHRSGRREPGNDERRTVDGREAWPALYIPNLFAAGLLCYHQGTVLIQREVGRVLLIDAENRLIDSRGLQDGERKNPRQNLLMFGARLIEQVASEVYKASQGWRAGVRRLMN
nr:uncharacterized protein LOC109748887 [Aegilops tauschii subsp. strangulata]